MDEQDGFLSGYLDCYVWDLKGSHSAVQPIEAIIAEVSKYYEEHPKARNVPVPEALHILLKPDGRAAKGERHGVYDGDYWRQADFKHRAAFVRGYLTCLSVRPKPGYSQPIENYVDAISKWYGVSDKDEGQLNEKTANEKIGDVLARLCDPSLPQIPHHPHPG